LSKESSAEKCVEIGVVGRPHGVRGALHVFLHNPASEILKEVESVVLETGGADAAAYRIADVRRSGKSCVVVLDGVDSRVRAEALTGARVIVPRSALPPLDEGEYYVDDLMGLEVRSEGRLLGTVTGSRAQGGIEVLTVRGEAHDIDVPLIAEYVVAIDLAAARIEARDTDDLPRTARDLRRDAGV
jgi:16S rRNA processing protein RimM